MEQARGEGLPDRIERDPGDEASVQLHELGTELEDVAEAREPGAGVVDRPSQWNPDPRDSSSQLGVIDDTLSLGDLEHDRPRWVDQRLSEATVIEHERRRDV